MQTNFRILQATRQNIIKSITDYSVAQLNLVPEGFNNNLVWQLGHIVVTQQLLCYRMASQSGYSSEKMIATFRKGTKPEGDIEAGDIDRIKYLLNKTTEQIERDYDDGIFIQYKPYTTSYGFTINNIEEAIAFNNVHEGMHLGMINAMRKVLS